MKIAFITFQYPPFVQGGAGTYAYNITRELAKLGHEVHVIAPRVAGCGKESVEEGLFVHRISFLNKPFLRALSFWFSLRKDFPSLERQAGGFDIVHSNGPIDLSLTQKVVSSLRVIEIHHLARTTVKALEVSLVGRVRNLRGEIGITPLIEPICIRRADRITTVSQFTKKDITDVYGIPQSRIEVIYRGIYPEDYVFPEEAKVKLRSTLGIESQPVILFAGKLAPRKGVDVLIRALPQVLKEVEVKLVLAGSGNQRGYQHLAQTLGISDKLRFLGRVPDDTLRLLFSSCDLFVLPSRLEGFGLVMLEAMAAGKPIVATNVGGIPELIESGENGILVEVNNEGELANAMVKVLGDNLLARAIGDNNLKKVHECFSWEVAARKTERVYNELRKK